MKFFENLTVSWNTKSWTGFGEMRRKLHIKYLQYYFLSKFSGWILLTKKLQQENLMFGCLGLRSYLSFVATTNNSCSCQKAYPLLVSYLFSPALLTEALSLLSFVSSHSSRRFISCRVSVAAFNFLHKQMCWKTKKTTTTTKKNWGEIRRRKKDSCELKSNQSSPKSFIF